MNGLTPEMEKELEEIGEEMSKPFISHSFSSTEFWMLMYVLVVLTFNFWLKVPEKNIDLMVLIVGAYAGVRQGIKYKNGGK